MASAVLELQKVSLSFSKAILHDVSYSVQPGDFVVILGSNGSGKSSLLKLINRSYRPSQGKLLLKAKSLEVYPMAEFNRQVKTLTQDCDQSLFTCLTVYENCLLALGKRKACTDFLPDYLLQFNQNLAVKMHQQVASLSGGEKQALALALAVLQPPQILLLDEHTSALDPISAAKLMALTHRIVKQHRITCLLTTHDLNHAQQYGNRVLAMRQGEIYQTFDDDKKLNLTHASLLTSCY